MTTPAELEMQKLGIPNRVFITPKTMEYRPLLREIYTTNKDVARFVLEKMDIGVVKCCGGYYFPSVQEGKIDWRELTNRVLENKETGCVVFNPAKNGRPRMPIMFIGDTRDLPIR